MTYYERRQLLQQGRKDKQDLLISYLVDNYGFTKSTKEQDEKDGWDVMDSNGIKYDIKATLSRYLAVFRWTKDRGFYCPITAHPDVRYMIPIDNWEGLPCLCSFTREELFLEWKDAVKKAWFNGSDGNLAAGVVLNDKWLLRHMHEPYIDVVEWIKQVG